MSKKTMIIAGCSIIGILVLLILFVWLLTAFKKNYVTYEKLEEKMVVAADKYYKTYPELLPVDEGKYTLQYNALVENNLIKPLNEMLKNGDSCTAEVNVYKNNVGYDYIPKIDCGTDYKTIELNERIIYDNPITETGSGLYKNEDGSYYFRGKVENNYFALGTTKSGKKTKDLLWRILGIDEKGNIKLLSLTGFKDKTVYDDRYNVETAKTSGYNDYAGSKLKDFLIRMSNEETFLTNEEKQKLISQQLCIGKRKLTDEINDGSIECSELSEEVLYGTITPYEYIRASLDENCKKVSDRSCGNFNFLYVGGSSSWSITSIPDNSYQSYTLVGDVFEAVKPNLNKKVYPTVYVSSRTLYKAGTGTIDDPYRLDNKKAD